MLHVFLGDIFEKPPGGLQGQWREYRIEAYGSRMWLFHRGAYVKDGALKYAERLRQTHAEIPEARKLRAHSPTPTPKGLS